MTVNFFSLLNFCMVFAQKYNVRFSHVEIETGCMLFFFFQIVCSIEFVWFLYILNIITFSDILFTGVQYLISMFGFFF